MPTTKRKPRTTATPPPRPVPRLRVIEGALSIYRPGDEISFTLFGEGFSAPVTGSHTKDGVLYVDVSLNIGINSALIKCVERAESEVR